MKPATSSDSASTRSKGGRLVSARDEIKKTTNIGKSGSQYQSSIEAGSPKEEPTPAFCAFTIAVRFREPTSSSTVMTTKPSETSYEIICAAERKLPMNG